MSAAVVERMYVIVPGDPLSRRTLRCQCRAGAAWPSHHHPRRCRTSTSRRPAVLARKTTRRQASGGCAAAQGSTGSLGGTGCPRAAGGASALALGYPRLGIAPIEALMLVDVGDTGPGKTHPLRRADDALSNANAVWPGLWRCAAGIPAASRRRASPAHASGSNQRRSAKAARCPRPSAAKTPT